MTEEKLKELGLPPKDTQRWVARLKQKVVRAVQGNKITLGEVLEVYRMSMEEYLTWEKANKEAGEKGLKAHYLRSTVRNKQKRSS